MNINKMLVVAPHPDDEINLAGQLIVKAVKENIEVYVLYTTNGDATKKEKNNRVQEAINALKVLGVQQEHIVFLGYANEWKENEHIYYAEKDLISTLNKTATNCFKGHDEYCFKKNQTHHVFTYENFKNDMKSVIEDIAADVLICVDFDSHPDHRAASLTFDRCMGEILKERRAYRPIVLKKYAYNGVWKGEKDYYVEPFQRTKHETNFFYSGDVHELESPNFSWKDRISLCVPKETITPLLKKNILYKAARQHTLTTAWYEMQRVINSDVVYWNRPTNNVMLEGILQASSGETKYINDFMMYDAGNILDKNEPFREREYCWRPDVTDTDKTLTVQFYENKRIRKIVVYEDFDVRNHIKKLKIQLGEKVLYCEPNRNGTKTEIVLDKSTETDKIVIKVCDVIGNGGLCEVEAYTEEASFSETTELLKNWTELQIPKYSVVTRMEQNAERLSILFEFAIRFKIKYEVNRLLKRNKR